LRGVILRTLLRQVYGSYLRLPIFLPLVRGDPFTQRHEILSQNTRDSRLSCGENPYLSWSWSRLPQASHLPSLGPVTSITSFGWPRRPVRFAG